MTIQELKQKRYSIVQEMRALIDKADAEKRSMTAEEVTKYNNMDKEVDELSADIARREKEEQREKEFAARNEQEERKDFEDKKNGIEDREKLYHAAFREYLIKGAAGLDPEQQKILSEKRALSAVTGASGGYTVPQGFYNEIVDAMKFYGGMRQARTTKLNTASGNDMPIPTANDTSVVGELLAENASAATGDIGFNQVVMKAYKYSSKVVLVPFELLQDSAFNLESFIARKLGERIGRITNTHFTTGDNSGKPQGILTAATLGKTGANGQTTSVTYDDLVDLIHAVDPAYRTNAQFMFNDSTLKALKKMKDGQQRPLWVPGLIEKEPDTILGYSYVINNDMPAMDESAKSILFGDMSNYFIRDVMNIEFYRIVDKYIESGQVGFLCFYRGDGRMVNAGMNPVAYYQNSAS